MSDHGAKKSAMSMSINASTDHARCCSTPNPSRSSCCQVVQTFEETVQRDSSRALVNQYSQDDQPFSFYACPLPGCHAIVEEKFREDSEISDDDDFDDAYDLDYNSENELNNWSRSVYFFFFFLQMFIKITVCTKPFGGLSPHS